MKLRNLAVRTRMIQAGMTLQDVFEECIRCSVPGLPFADPAGTIIGRISIRDVFKRTCIPDYMVKAAHLLGDNIDFVNIPESHAAQVLAMPAESYVLKNIAHVSSESPVVKALAIMEEFGTGYIFLIDAGEYQGVVTRMGIARRMLESAAAGRTSA
jgi:predicted transcriptional regulator